MPDRGLLEVSAVEGVELDSTRGVSLTGARWLQVTYEVNREAALAMMPADVGRPIPPYGRLLVGGSAAGNVAILSVGGRYRMMPRNVVVAAVADGPFEAVRGAFGSGSVTGAVSLEREGGAVTATVSGPDGPLASVTLPDIYAIEPTMLRWDAFVVLGRHDGTPSIAEVTPSHEVRAAFLSKGAVVEMERSLPRAHVWRRLANLNVVSACFAEGTLNFGEPVVSQAL
jgi:hypothetical protein